MNLFIEKKYLPVNNTEYTYYDLPILKTELLIYRNKFGTIEVFSSFCPHFGGKLEIKEDNLYCNFHGYKFNKEDGVCINRNVGSKCKKYEYFIEVDGLSLEIY